MAKHNHKKFYLLESVSTGNASWKKNITADDLIALGTGDMLKAIYDSNADGKVNGSDMADKLATARKINGVNFDGSADITVTDATRLPLAGGTMTGDLTLKGDPTSPLHAATKQYVDAVAQGADLKASCRVATIVNIALSGVQTIDGVALTVNDRVLVKNQTTAKDNGIYAVQSGAWLRATDADTSAKVSSGMFTFVEEGTTNADNGWVLITDGNIALGTTALTFTQFSGAGQVVAGSNIIKTGNTISVADSPNFTGTPIASTATKGTSTQQIATTAFVMAALDDGDLG